jgi:hypothetical protein
MHKWITFFISFSRYEYPFVKYYVLGNQLEDLRTIQWVLNGRKLNWICTLSSTETYLRVMLCGTGIALFSRATSKIRSGSILAMGSKWNQIGNIFYAAVVYSSGTSESLWKGGQSLELTNNLRKYFCSDDNSVKTLWGQLTACPHMFRHPYRSSYPRWKMKNLPWVDNCHDLPHAGEIRLSILTIS